MDKNDWENRSRNYLTPAERKLLRKSETRDELVFWLTIIFMAAWLVFFAGIFSGATIYQDVFDIWNTL